MARAATPPPGRWNAPNSYDVRRQWPRASFDHVKDPRLRQALREAQSVARVVLRGQGERRLTERQLSAVSGVERNTLRKALSGGSWPSMMTVSRLLHAVGAAVRIEEAEPPE